MKISKIIICGIGFVSSIALLFYAYYYFQVGNNSQALISLLIGVVGGIFNFKALVED